MSRPTTPDALAVIRSWTPAEHAYYARRAAEIQKAGGSAADQARKPYEEITAARALKGGAK